MPVMTLAFENGNRPPALDLRRKRRLGACPDDAFFVSVQPVLSGLTEWNNRVLQEAQAGCGSRRFQSAVQEAELAAG